MPAFPVAAVAVGRQAEAAAAAGHQAVAVATHLDQLRYAYILQFIYCDELRDESM